MFQNAEAYERFMGRWSRGMAPPFATFASVGERSRILDVGSGTGSLAFAIGDRLPEALIVGIDKSREYVEYAIERNGFQDRIGFKVGDAQQLKFEDASFDAAVSLLVFNFIPDPKKALFELCRVIKPGGSISAAVWDYGRGMQMLRTFWDAAIRIDPAAEKVDEKNMPLCRQGDLSALWNQVGLGNIHEEAIDITMQFSAFADYWEPFLLGQGPAGSYARHLSGGKLKDLRAEIKGCLGLSAKDKPFLLPARAWAVRGIVPDRVSR